MLVEIGIVHQSTRQSNNDEGDEELEAADDGDPDGSLEHMLRPFNVVVCRRHLGLIGFFASVGMRVRV